MCYHYKKADNLARQTLYWSSQLFVTHVNSSPKGITQTLYLSYIIIRYYFLVFLSLYESFRKENLNQI